MSKKVLRTVGKVAGIVAGVAMIGTGIGAALGGTMLLSIGGMSVAASAIAGAASVLSAGASLLGKQKPPTVSPATEDRLNLSLDVHAPRIMAFGETALGTDLRDQEFTGGDKEYLHRFVVVAAHKINAVKEIWFDDQLAWTAAGGVQGEFAGYLQVTIRTEGTPANAINISSRMGASRRFTGCAYVHFRFKLTGNSKKTESPFAQQVPTRMTIIGEGIPCYDPRQDSTQPGGSGSHRADDQSTWTWGTHCHNLACQYATYLLGWRIQNPQSGTWLLSVGAGTPPDRIDWASFIEGANLCDEAVALAAGGTEPRYHGAGLVADNEDPPSVTEAFKAAMNADVDDQDGLIRLTVFHNDLALPVAEFTEADVEADYTWVQTQPAHESFNVVRGRYVEPSALYQLAPYADAKLPPRGAINRVHPADFRFVQRRSHAERLAKQKLQRQQYGGQFSATFLASGWKVQKNSIVKLSFAPEGFASKLFRVAEYENARPDGRVPMVLREEHADIYAWDKDESPAVQIAEPTEYLPGDAPIPQFLGTIEEGATKGAPSGTVVNDRPAEDVTDAIDEQGDALALLDAAMLQAESDIAAAESQITGLLGNMAAAQAAILTAQGDIVTNADAIGTITASVAGNSTAITNLQGSYASLSQIVSAAGGGSLSRNAGFDDYPSGATGALPAHWVNNSNTGAATRVADPQGGYAIRLPAAAGQTVNMVQVLAAEQLLTQDGYYVIEADVLLNSGTFAGAGMWLQVRDQGGANPQTLNLDLAGDPDATGAVQSSPTTGRAYSWRKLVRVTAANPKGFNLYVNSHSSTHTGGIAAANDITWRKALVRPATSAEIAAGVALPALSATVTTQATAISGLQGQYALLSSDLATLGSTVSTQATAISDLEGSYAGLSQTLTASLNSGALNFDPEFNAFTNAGSGVTPDLWPTNILNPSAHWRAAKQSGVGFAWQQRAGVGVQTFGEQQVNVPLQQNGYYVIEADIYLWQGTMVGSGVLFRVLGPTNQDHNLVFSTTPDETGSLPSGVSQRMYRFRKLVKVTVAGSTGFILRPGAKWANFGNINTGFTFINFERVALRPATPQEIAAGVALPALEATVSANSSALATLDSQYASISLTVSAQGLTVSEHTTAINGMAGRWAVAIDVNGRVVGRVKLDGTGQTSSFDVEADAFRITKPGGGERYEFIEGVHRTITATMLFAHGDKFGTSSQFVQWYGPRPTGDDIALCSEANALFYVRVDGAMYFGGAVPNMDNVLKNLIGTVRGNSFVQVGTIISATTTDTGGLTAKWSGAASLFYGTNANYEFKLQHSPDKSTWTDFAGTTKSGTAVATPPVYPYDPVPDSSGSATGLTANRIYHVRMVARITTTAIPSPNGLTFDGNVVVQGS